MVRTLEAKTKKLILVRPSGGKWSFSPSSGGREKKSAKGVFLLLINDNEKPPFASPFNKKALIRRKGAFLTRGGHTELFNQILIGRFSLPLFRRIMDQSISIIKRQFDLIRLSAIHQPQRGHVVKRRPTTMLASTNNNLTCQCQ